MFEAWFNFFVIVFVQLVLFLAHALYEKKFAQIIPILSQAIFGGIVLGLSFDLLFGKFFGMYSYTVGFDFLPLLIIAVFGYGLFVAHVLLMKEVTLVNFWFRIMLVAAGFEIANVYFPTWVWEFPWTFSEYLFVQSAGNFGAAVLVAIFWHFSLSQRFTIIDKLLKSR